MKISIFKRLRLRLKRWFEYVEFLGRARRGAAKRLTLPDLEREVRTHMGVALTANSRPPRFAALRYALMGDRGLAPWVTHEAVLAQFSKGNNGLTTGFPHLSIPIFFVSIATLGFLGVHGCRALKMPDLEIASIVVLLISTIATIIATRERVIIAFDVLSQVKTSDDTAHPDGCAVSEAIARYVTHRLEGVKEGVVGKKTVHAKTRERADGELREARASWTQLHLRICQRYGEGISDDASVELTDEQVPAHLRVLREELRLILQRAEDTLRQLDKFESNITAALDELGAEARADLVLYEDLDLIEGIRRLGGRVGQTARDARRSIAQALESLQERMDALRVDVLRREELIGSIVQALPMASDRGAEWQRLEDVVQGLSSPPRQRTLA